MRARTNIVVNTQIDRAHCRPWGLEGGLDGTGNRVALRLNGDLEERLPQRQGAGRRLKEGDAFRLHSGGGGGHGAPFERPMEDVQSDVQQGYISVEAAAESYGVVIDPTTFEIDVTASRELRAHRNAEANAGTAPAAGQQAS